MRYLRGPKRDSSCTSSTAPSWRTVHRSVRHGLPMRCDRTRRPRPGAGQWSQWEAIWVRRRDGGRYVTRVVGIPVPRASRACDALPCGAYCFALPGSLRSRDACRPMGDIEQRKDAARCHSRGRIDARVRGAPGSNPRRGEGRRAVHRARRTRRGETVPCRGCLRSGAARPSQRPRHLRDPATPSIRRRGRLSRPSDVMSCPDPAECGGEG